MKRELGSGIECVSVDSCISNGPILKLDSKSTIFR